MSQRLSSCIVLTAVALSCLPQLASAQGNLVFNGDFNTISNSVLVDWALINGAYPDPKLGNPAPGVQLVNSVSSPSLYPTASQTINGLIPDTTYIVSGDFIAVHSPPATPSFGVALDNTTFYFHTSNPNELGAWANFNFYYTATSTSTVLSLFGQMDGTGLSYVIDNIAMYAIPEPSNLWLIGIGGMASALFFKNRRSLS